MVEIYGNPDASRHLVVRNLIGAIVCTLLMLGVWASADPGESMTWILGVGALFGGYGWIAVMFVSARGY